MTQLGKEKDSPTHREWYSSPLSSFSPLNNVSKQYMRLSGLKRGGFHSWVTEYVSCIFIKRLQGSGQERFSSALGFASLKELWCMTEGDGEARVPPSPRTWEQQPELAPHALRDALQHQLPSFFCAVHADPLPILSKVNLPGLLFQKLLGLKGIMTHDDIPKDFEDGERSHGKCEHCPLRAELSSGQNSWEGRTQTFWPPALIGPIYHVLRSCHDAFWPRVRILLPWDRSAECRW